MSNNRHSQRGSNGKFQKMNPQTDLVPVNTSADDTMPGNTRPRYVSSADDIDGPTAHRTAVIIDAQTGQHLATVAHDDLRTVLGRTSGHLADVDGVGGQHDTTAFLGTGK